MIKTFKLNITKTRAGFTLIEMAVVLVIVGLLLAAFLTPLSVQRDLRDYSETRTRLEQIRESLYGYAMINGKLPCPTTTANPADNVNYGHSDATCPLTAGAGVLPWKDLGIHEVDAWGTPRVATADLWLGYWVYRVDPAFASSFSLSTTATGNIDVKKADGNSQTIAGERAVAVICSTGKNKIADGDNATYETVNPVYQDDVLTPTFDDICIWITRPSLFNRMVTAGKLP
ncbi:MAG: prepilin-type N-terminal cleavage/methylation domain-containing protein [Methylophilaceae bacterium]